MGMYDYVRYECRCPVCQGKVDDFQTKDLDCDLVEVEVKHIDNFYDICPGCGCWVEFNRLDNSRFERTIERKNKILSEYAKIINFKGNCVST